uniref:Uncharacterized protein n=1 Tax=Oryza glumipatula TaxID=40148 RepID=A0A0E0A5X5_9ORYZ
MQPLLEAICSVFTIANTLHVEGNMASFSHHYQKGDGKNKRTRISESGAYTSSSNQDTEEESSNKKKHSNEHKKAKERLKGKGKAQNYI